MSVKSYQQAASPAWVTALRGGSYSDVALAFGVVAIVALMILPLRTAVIDVLVAVNISIGVGLLLVALYIPSPVAFSSFPSVLLITTLFRLSLAIATTRLILLDANAGHIIDTFGKLGAGGNLIVGIVVFLIITIVQFIVIAKGAERVAEVAARFTLDAMPGKQLSIDSDLRSGLVEKDEAKKRRRVLEIESQLYGSLDGAMKFVKGDAIAGIVIIVVNLLGGLGVGILQRGLSLAEAMETYSILTIGDGLVTQIPALLGSIAAGLVVTRTASEERDRHLGEAITRQIVAQPRVLLITGLIACFLTLVPGFPKWVFLGLGIVLTVVGAGRSAGGYAHIKTLLSGKRNDRTAQAASESGDDDFMRMLPLALEIAKRHQNLAAAPDLEQRLNQARAAVYRDLGVLVPEMKLRSVDDLGEHDWRLSISEVPAAGGKLPPEAASGMRGDAVEFLANQAASVLRRQASQFLGIQEVNVLVAQMSQDHPELVKEMLRAVPLQKVADVLRRLVEEGVSVRNLRAIFETLADVGQREKDAAILTEYVRTGLKRYLSSKYVSADGLLRVILLHPELEEKFRQSVRVAGGVAQLALDPELAGRVLAELRVKYGSTSGAHSAALLTSIDIRRHVRKLTEIEFFELPVLSYQELASDIKVQPIAQLGAPRDERLSVAARDGSIAGAAAAQQAGAA